MIYPSIYQGPPAGYTKVVSTKRYIAIHATANDASAENEMSYARTRTDNAKTSAHYYVDSDSIVQGIDTKYQAWHAGSATGNARGIAYELTGTNGKSRASWLASLAWPKLARQIALDCAEHGITPRLLTIAQMQDGKSTGIVTHDMMRRAWGGTDHTDPGPNFPMDHLIEMVKTNGANMATVQADLIGTDDQRLHAATVRDEARVKGTPTYSATWTDATTDTETSREIQQLLKIDDVLAAVKRPVGVTLSDADLQAIITGVSAAVLAGLKASLRLTFAPTD